jgi:hypothetical protein
MLSTQHSTTASDSVGTMFLKLIYKYQPGSGAARDVEIGRHRRANFAPSRMPHDLAVRRFSMQADLVDDSRNAPPMHFPGGAFGLGPKERNPEDAAVIAAMNSNLYSVVA